MTGEQDIHPEMMTQLAAALREKGFDHSRYNPDPALWFRQVGADLSVYDEVRIPGGRRVFVQLVITPEDLPALLRYKETAAELAALKAERGGDTQ